MGTQWVITAWYATFKIFRMDISGKGSRSGLGHVNVKSCTALLIVVYEGDSSVLTLDACFGNGLDNGYLYARKPGMREMW